MMLALARYDPEPLLAPTRFQSDVLPSLSPDHEANDAVAHIREECRDLLARHPGSEQRSNLAHPFIGELTQRIALTDGTPSFPCHVGVVVSVRSGEQMSRTDTWWIVAVVQDIKPIRDLSVVRTVGNSMGVVSSPMPSGYTDLAVPFSGPGASPDPAWAEFWLVAGDGAIPVDLAPESFLKGTKPSDCASAAAIQAGSIGARREGFGALGADARDRGTMSGHLDSPPGVTPPAVRSGAEASLCAARAGFGPASSRLTPGSDPSISPGAYTSSATAQHINYTTYQTGRAC